MSDSQEQSLDENVVFLPVKESSPEFLYCETERQALEKLLSSGPEAFYGSISSERSGCFLSPEEVGQITSWAEDYHLSPLQKQENGDQGGSEMEDFSTYFPSLSDLPAPNLELGWPEKSPWATKANVTVHTNPPAEGEPPVREVIRRHLQKACQVIAIVTDRLTDGAVIGDLCGAASRGVPVYIILSQRSIQENFTLNRLRHPNMQVRVLGGKSFCSRSGRVVVGELKEKFLLVDLETVIHGSYSLTWTDAHLHRQLVTVLTGPVVDSFDREFRILFAASLPVPDTWRPVCTYRTHLNDYSDVTLPNHLPLESEVTNPPSPPADSLLDWEEMGVFPKESLFLDNPPELHEDIMAMQIPLQNNMQLDNHHTPMGGFSESRNQFLDTKRIHEHNSPVMNNLPHLSPTHGNTQSFLTDSSNPEKTKRLEHKTDKPLSRQPFTNSDYRLTRHVDNEPEPVHRMETLSPTKTRLLTRENVLEEETNSTDEPKFQVENKPSSRKPIILRVPQTENVGSLSDILKRIRQKSASGFKESKAAVSEMSQSMLDLSVHNKDTDRDGKEVPVPRFRADSFDVGLMTPALALMKKRNDNIKNALYRPLVNFQPRERPRSYAFGAEWTEWRKPRTKTEGEKEERSDMEN
ncbi:uncharacterized protein fam83e [Sphaeramia orbicularis]|uniref:Uncharacterized LOC115419375 n=1 Tax=Sphaeramia orbicularis TaxID=375764 RepID=A0A673A1C2_9TELE|nr:uncharacterized protein LOC115419375 [Sphaeramia orbicularis]